MTALGPSFPMHTWSGLHHTDRVYAKCLPVGGGRPRRATGVTLTVFTFGSTTYRDVTNAFPASSISLYFDGQP